MSRVPHHLHIYQKPALVEAGAADTPLRRLLALNYRHKISAMGGFDTASCDVGVDRSEAEFIFGNLVGNRVAVYADNPVVPIWEGLISRVTIAGSGAERTRSLEDMANRVVVQFTGGALNMTQTGEVTNDASIDVYGSKMKHFDAGEMYSNATSFAEALRDARLTQLAYPPVSTVSGGGGDFRVSIEMIGFYHTLTWDTFEVIDTGTVTNAPAEILLDGTGDDYSYNYGIFYDDTDSSRIASTAWSINNSRQLGESSWDLLLRIAEAGNSGDRRIVGIGEANPNTGSRIAYYEDANEDVEYTTYAYGDGRIYSIFGQQVNPWDVRPNRSIRLNDILIGQPDGASDAKTAYITSVEYDAENGTVSWITDDNMTLEGVFNLDKESKATNERFGATTRSALIDPLTPGQGGTGADNSTGANGQLLVRDGANGDFEATSNMLLVGLLLTLGQYSGASFILRLRAQANADTAVQLREGSDDNGVDYGYEAANNFGRISVVNTGTTINAMRFERTTGDTFVDQQLQVGATADKLRLADSGATAIIDSEVNPLVLRTSAAQNISFETNGANTRMTIQSGGNVNIVNTLSKGGGSFDIDHPSDPANRRLIHSFVEAPEGLLVYRGEAQLVDGKATVDIDQYFGMTPGTFTLLTRKAQVTNLCCPYDFELARIDPAHKEAVHSGILYIETQDKKSAATVSWMVTAERNDPFWKSCDLTDENGNFIVEVEKADMPADMLAEREDESSEQDYDEPVTGSYKGIYRHPDAFGVSNPTRRVRGTKPKEKPKEQIRKTDD